MAYATSQRFIQSFGLDETVQLLTDEQRLLTAELLTAALAEVPAWPVGATVEQQAAAADAADRLLRKLEIQSNFMDGYLRSAVSLPLSALEANASTLEECCLALARCALADDAGNWTDRMDAAFDRWSAWLKDIATGKVKLVLPAAEGTSQSTMYRVKSGKGKSGFNWAGYPGGDA